MYEKDPVKIFVVEDDPAYTKFLNYVLGLNPDFEVEYFSTGKTFLSNLHKNPSIVTRYARLFITRHVRRIGA